MASTILRSFVWLTLLGGSIGLYWWKPLALIVVGVLLAVVLVVSKLLGDLFWNTEVTDPTPMVAAQTGGQAGGQAGQWGGKQGVQSEAATVVTEGRETRSEV